MGRGQPFVFCRDGAKRSFDRAVDSREKLHRSSPPSGFTVLELLVVLAVIALVVTLILPAIQSARDAARRIGCSNNLRQIGVALQSYHATEKCLPSGWVLEVPIGRDSSNGWGWLAMLLPMMDQKPLFNAINFNHHLGNECNETARLTVVESFVCPADHTPKQVPFYWRSLSSAVRGASRAASPWSAGSVSTNGEILFHVAGANYAGVFGIEDPDDRCDTHGLGVFSLNSSARFADMLDGASQTLIVGERSASRMGTTWTGMHVGEEEGPERVVGFVDHSPNDPAADEAEFSSRHVGGVHFLLGDGSVRFLSDHMDRAVFRSLATRCGQEVIGHDRF